MLLITDAVSVTVFAQKNIYSHMAFVRASCLDTTLLLQFTDHPNTLLSVITNLVAGETKKTKKETNK